MLSRALSLACLVSGVDLDIWFRNAHTLLLPARHLDPPCNLSSVASELLSHNEQPRPLPVNCQYPPCSLSGRSCATPQVSSNKDEWNSEKSSSPG
jgi:hypothetical protein